MSFAVADTIKLPPAPTREEIVAYCNQGVERSHPVTIESVRYWERRKLIKRIRGTRRPVRYDVSSVVDFLNNRMGMRF